VNKSCQLINSLFSILKQIYKKLHNKNFDILRSFEDVHFNNNQTANSIVKNQYNVKNELMERLVAKYEEENKYLKNLIEKLTSKD
jgi:glutathione peroxidase-family protein